MAKKIDPDAKRDSSPSHSKPSGRQLATAPAGTPTDYAAIALSHLNSTAASTDLRGLAHLVAKMRAGESLEGKGTAAAKARRGASRAAATVAARLRELDLRTIIEALARPAAIEASRPGQAVVDVEHRLHLVQWCDALLAALDRLAEGLAIAADMVPALPRARPTRSSVLAFALEALELTWWRCRSEVPTQSTAKGGFMAFAQDVLTSAPCSFARGSVQKAVRVYLKDEDRPARKAARGAAATPEPPRSVLVIGADDPVLKELARHYAEAGARVVATAAPERVAALRAELADGIAVVPLSLTRGPKADDLAALGAGKLDVMVVGGLTGRTGVIEPMGADDFDRADLTGQATAALSVPPVLHGIVRAMRQRLAAGEGATLAVITSPLASATKGRMAGGYAGTPAYAAIQALVGLWARDLHAGSVTVVAMHAGWGQRDDGTPNRHSVPATAARVMATTIGRLGPREHGELIDLNGSLEPR